MNKQEMWQETRTVYSYDRDLHGLLSLQAVGNYFQDAAGSDANNRGFGMEDLMKHNEIWVLARMKIKMGSYANWGDGMTVQTWVENIEHYYAERHFLLTRGNQVIARGMSNWAVIDTERRRPKRVDAYKHNMPVYPGKRALEEKLRRLPGAANEECSYTRTARYSELDELQHVNNVKYYDWVLDCYSMEFHLNFLVDSFEIDFLAETHCGEEMGIHTKEMDDTQRAFHHSAVRQSDQKEVIRAAVKWRPYMKAGK